MADPKRTHKVLWFIATMTVVFAAGYYRQTIQTGESVHFALNYPAEGDETGGLGALGADGKLVVQVEKVSPIKKLLQPNVFNLSSHWLRNVGDTPRHIRLELEGFNYPVRWESTDKTWDEETHSIGRILEPGEDVTVDWFVTLPRPVPTDDVIIEGAIVVIDADTGERLTVFPVKFMGGDAVIGEGGDCCG
ncbi:MAG: hypothetical protein Q7W51_03805 [Coriobacteriia bacterium]|nr:hypothetical protein [Coriobacteriia bacterium]